MGATSYNGWAASKNRAAIGVVDFTIAGVPFPGGVKGGDVATVLGYCMEQYHRRVEKLVPSLGCWGHAFRPNRNNPLNLSCHSSGTATDANASKHPNGRKGTFTPKQLAEIRAILAEVDHVIRWGGDFHGTPDEMHWEVNATAAQLAVVARKLRSRTKASATKPVAKPPADPRLHQGVQGQRVLDVQNALLRLGYKPDASEVKRGFWGQGTDRAFRRFQTDGGRNADGITWAADWAALRQRKRAA